MPHATLPALQGSNSRVPLLEQLRCRLVELVRAAHLFEPIEQVVHAETDDKSGKEALLQLAGLTDGSYAFYRENLSPERTITEPTPQLILDLARSLDERSTESQTS